MSRDEQQISAELQQAKLIMERVLGPKACIEIGSGFGIVIVPDRPELFKDVSWPAHWLEGSLVVPERGEVSTLSLSLDSGFAPTDTIVITIETRYGSECHGGIPDAGLLVHCRKTYLKELTEWAIARQYLLAVHPDTNEAALPTPPYELMEYHREGHQVAFAEADILEAINTFSALSVVSGFSISCPYCGKDGFASLTNIFSRCENCCRMFGIRINPDGTHESIPLN
jgi:hypothetical protein